ncbi:unnamed protein product, partial [Hapterophycus canaliculatus]
FICPLQDLCGSSDVVSSRHVFYHNRRRHRQHVEACLLALRAAQRPRMPLDLAAEELRIASSELGRITGAVGVEELLDVIFRDFCIGK